MTDKQTNGLDPETLGLDHHVYPSGVPSVDYSYKQDPGGQSGELKPTDFEQMAREAVAVYYNRVLQLGQDSVLPSDVFITWFSKTLKNWKAMCSTVFPDGRYFELTFNGDNRELYVDEYVKRNNQVFLEMPIPEDDGGGSIVVAQKPDGTRTTVADKPYGL